MGRHTSNSRKLTPAVNMAEIITAIENSSSGGGGGDEETPVLLQTEPGVVLVNGTSATYTNISKSSVYGSALYDNRDVVELGGFYWAIRNSYSIYSVDKLTIGTMGTNGVPTWVSHGSISYANGRAHGITTDGTDLYFVDYYNYIRRYSTDGTLISSFSFAALLPGFFETAIDRNYNTRATAITCDGNTLFLRTLYSLDEDTLVGMVIFEFTLDGTLIRNTVENTDYHVILDPGSNYTDSNIINNRYYCAIYNTGSMTMYNNKIWMKFTSSTHSYAIINYNLDFTRGNLAIQASERYLDYSPTEYKTTGEGGILFDDDGNIQYQGYHSRRYVLTRTDDAIRVTAPSLGIIAEAGDTIIVNGNEALVTLVENDNTVSTSTTVGPLDPVELSDAVVYRKNAVNDKLALVDLLPLVYGLRTL